MRGLTRWGGGATQPWSGGMMNVLDDLRTEFDRFFREAESFLPTAITREEVAFIPAVDIEEKDNEYLIHAEVPGIDPKDIDVRIEGNTLMIKGERRHEEEEKGRNFFRRERTYGSFARAFTLPDIVDADNVKAKCKGGVLTVTVPKAQEAKTSKVEVETEA